MSFVTQSSRASPEEERPGGLDEQVRALRAALVAIVGERWVQTDPCVLDTYAWQYLAETVTGSQYMPRPLAVVLPSTTAEVAGVVKVCSRFGVQYKAMSTGFGMWNGSLTENQIVQIDLRRLDKIVQIDRDNMYAVVEPYVTGNQLQTEAMKVGLNVHIAGCGGQCSVLASATSMMGQGGDGISMGFSNRNLLGFEWVMPDGEVVQVGSFDSASEDFLGDGPGFSVRGIVRGFAGALGGLGVFTRAAVKLYPWDGPPRLEREGLSPIYCTKVPDHHTAAELIVHDWAGMAGLGYRISEAEIASHLGRSAPSGSVGVLATDSNEAADLYSIPLVHELYYVLACAMTAAHDAEGRYKRRVLRRILKETGGGMLSNDFSPAGIWYLARWVWVIRRRIGTMGLLRSLPGFAKMLLRSARMFGPAKGLNILPSFLYDSMIRMGAMVRGVFRFAGTFWTAMGSLVAWDNAIRGAKVGAQVKQKYIDQGIIVDDGGDNAWGGFYEAGAYAHLEEICLYDPTDQARADRVLEYIVETSLACIENRCGDSLNAVGPPAHALFSPVCMDYDLFTQRIKREFDPTNVADGRMFTDPDFQPDARFERAMEAVLRDRAPVRLEG